MSDGANPPGNGWFEGLEPGDVEGASEAIDAGEAENARDWPALAVESGAVDSETEYYAWLHDAARRAAQTGAREREGADDRQLVHAVRAMDDCERTANELAERVAEWGASRGAAAGDDGDAASRSTGVEFARTLADREPAGPVDARLHALASRATGLADEAAELRAFVERTAPDVAPNLSAMAGPVLAARLLSLAGGLEALARMPSGTVQVLGAEQALFAHLRGDAPSPKHGAIYVHEYVRNTAPDERGSAARALAGKLAIAARIDHYAGDRRPAIQAELDERIARIRERSSADATPGVEQGEEEP